MDDAPCRHFFLQPPDAAQRLYEALRAVFVDGCRQKDVAARFGYSYAAFRQQVHQFRARCAAGGAPPFSARRRGPRRPPPPPARRAARNSPRSPTAAP